MSVLSLTFEVHEQLVALHCKLEEPQVDSHHDLLVSCAVVPSASEVVTAKSINILAPKIENKRVKVIWSEEGIASFKEIASVHLQALRDRWLKSSSPNKVISLSSTTSVHSEKILKHLRTSGNKRAAS